MDQEHIRGKASSLSFSNLYYVLRKYASHQRVINQLDSLEKLLEIQEVNGAMIRTALKSRFRDLEDAIQYQCAVSNPQISLIVSRNVKDYKYSELPVMSPRTFLASWYKSQG